MTNTQPKAPCLNRLPGDYKLPTLLRNTHGIQGGYFNGPARDWPQPKIVLNNYFTWLKGDDIIPKTGDTFHTEVTRILKEVSEVDLSGLKGNDKLCRLYCGRLYEFYATQSIRSITLGYYDWKQRQRHSEQQEKRTKLQVRTSTMALLEKEALGVETQTRTEIDDMTTARKLPTTEQSHNTKDPNANNEGGSGVYSLLEVGDKENVPPSTAAATTQVNNIGAVHRSLFHFNSTGRNIPAKRQATVNMGNNSKQIKNSIEQEDDEIEEEDKEEETREEPENAWMYFKRMLDIGRNDDRYHKYSAIRNGVIICGDGILPQKGIEQGHYKVLQDHFKENSRPMIYDDLSKKYLSEVLDASDINSFERSVRAIPAGSEHEVFFLQDMCFSILNLLKNNPDTRAEEKNFVDFFLTPFMRPTVTMMGSQYTYESRECFLKSINTIWKNSGVIRSTSEGFKADGIVRYKNLEIMLVEACGVYGNVSISKIQFDRHKGLYACLAMLRTIALKYRYASLSTFQELQIFFLHTKGDFIQLWSVSFINDIFVFNRHEKCELSLDIGFKSQTISNCLKFSNLIRSHLESMVNIIDSLSKEHTASINDDILGISIHNEDGDLATIVQPRTHKIKETKGESGLCYGDPVSSTD